MKHILLTTAALSLALTVSRPAFADAETDALRAQMQAMQAQMAAMQRKLDVLEHRQEKTTLPTAYAAPSDKKLAARVATVERKQQVDEDTARTAPKVDVGKQGLKVTSADGNYYVWLHGYAQFDNRTFIDDNKGLVTDNFLVRRARPIIESKADDFYFQLMPDFGGGTAALDDAYVDYRTGAYFNLRAGKFHVPLGLEVLKSSTDTMFVESSMPTNLVPNRDVGVMAYGNILPELSYQLGIFNGVYDGGSDDGDVDDKKELAARLFAQPFKRSHSALDGLGVGVAGSVGQKDGSATNREVGVYRTSGQATFFAYRDTSFANGDAWRLAPQGYYYNGPFGILAEYTISDQEVVNGANRARINNTAWETQFSYVLTGESAGYNGWPSPRHPFNPCAGQWGAWELATKYSELNVDGKAFPVFADPAASAKTARNFGIVLNGYLTDNAKVSLDYEHTAFDGGAASGADRETEQAILTRLNYKF